MDKPQGSPASPGRNARAGVLVLEELEHARARGAPILAEYIGGSFTCDAHHMTEPLPDGTGVGRCIAMCAAAGRPAAPAGTACLCGLGCSGLVWPGVDRGSLRSHVPPREPGNTARACSLWGFTRSTLVPSPQYASPWLLPSSDPV